MSQLLTLLAAGGDNSFTLHVANGLWVDERFQLSPAYAARVGEHYQAEAAVLDFAAPQGAAAAINAWVAQHTQGRITQLVAASMLSPTAPLVLGNAVYFKGSWASKFNELSTHPGPFTLASGQQRTVPLMQLRSRLPSYRRGPGWQAVRLGYSGQLRTASMLLLVPDEPASLPQLLASLEASSWTQWLASLAAAEDVEVDLTLPRCKLEWEQNLLPALAALGISPALAPGADFTPLGFAPGAPGFIGQVLHKTCLRVDEKGTEAAGTTLTMMIGGMSRPAPPRRVVRVRADRPFFCAIVDDETDLILFAGAVYEPA